MTGPFLAAALAGAAVASMSLRVEVEHRRAVLRRLGPRRGEEELGPPAPRRLGRRREATPDAMGSSVAAMAAAVRAGLSLPLALAYAAEEAEEPLRSELDELVERVRLGTPLDLALERWADRGGEDARLVAGALLLHRRTGGGLPAVLDRVAATLLDRAAARRELRSLTAQARLSGLVLGLLPVGFLLFLAATSPGDLAAVLAVPEGRAALAAGVLLELLAFAWIRRILGAA
jgi:tight adherence protein B